MNKLPYTARNNPGLSALYSKTPKHVLFDIALYLASSCADAADEPTGEKSVKRFLEEWACLYQNGLITTRPRA